jgi:hypothetical protein
VSMLKNNILATDKEMFEGVEAYTTMKSALRYEKSRDEVGNVIKYDPKKIFLVHGHDDTSKYDLKDILKN